MSGFLMFFVDGVDFVRLTGYPIISCRLIYLFGSTWSIETFLTYIWLKYVHQYLAIMVFASGI